MQKVKSGQWQMVRAILCIAVVLIHCNNDSGLNLWDSNSTYYLLFRNLINFPVAAFFFVSGYFDNCENTRGGGIFLLPKESEEAPDTVSVL